MNNAASPETSPPPMPPAAVTARRRATLAALFGLAAVGGPAEAQMGGGGGGRGMHGQGQPPEGARPDKDKDSHEPAPPRDLLSAFARRLREGVPELALAPAQQASWNDFVASVHEVGEHNERRLQRILFRSAATVSASAPLASYIAAEVDEGEGRQEALAELKVNHAKLDSLLDARQRDVLTRVFVAVRSELQAAPGR